MAERYWVPTSLPWRLSVVGSWIVKNTSSSSRYEISSGSKVTWTTSAWPVVPVHTSSYEGWGTCPPAYPDCTPTTPRSSRYTASRHQKQPPARVAISRRDTDDLLMDQEN